MFLLYVGIYQCNLEEQKYIFLKKQTQTSNFWMVVYIAHFE